MFFFGVQQLCEAQNLSCLPFYPVGGVRPCCDAQCSHIARALPSSEAISRLAKRKTDSLPFVPEFSHFARHKTCLAYHFTLRVAFGRVATHNASILPEPCRRLRRSAGLRSARIVFAIFRGSATLRGTKPVLLTILPLWVAFGRVATHNARILPEPRRRLKRSAGLRSVLPRSS